MGDVKRAARGFVPLARDGHGDEGQTKDLLRDSTDPAPGALEGQTKELLRDSTGVAYGFVAAELQARAAGTLQEICTRVNDALRRKGQTPDALFDALAAGGQEVRWPDFRALFAQLEPSLGEGQLQQLWITFDTNADGGISREEFRTQLAKLQALATGVVQTEDQIFDSLADSDHHVTFCAFSAYIAELQPDLEESQHQLLWEQFDKAEDGRVSRDSFVRTLSADQEDEEHMSPAPETITNEGQKHVQGLECSKCVEAQLRLNIWRELALKQKNELLKAENNVRRLEAQLMASAGLAFQAESHVRRLERKIKDLEDRQGGGGGKGWGFGGKNPMAMMATFLKGMKGKGKGKNPHRGKGHTLPRERISETPMIGEVLEWKGKYGWLKPQEPIQHEKASRHRGKIFASVADLVGVTELTVGRLVQFRLFSDQSGLGAEEIQQT